MLSSIQILVFIGMVLSALVPCILGLNNHILLYLSRKKIRRLKTPRLNEWPMVTIQIATYNEGDIIASTLDKCLEMDYPEDRLEIVIVDDSTDETIEVLRRYEAKYSHKIRVIHRSSREGYKAGALQTAIRYSRGDFFLILDADTRPQKDFLKKTIPYLVDDERLGFVQGRIEYIDDSSWLVRSISAVNRWYGWFLQSSLSKGDFFIAFQGRGGIFRRAAVEDVGGWQSDTITEDLDISYRMQMKGWRGLFVEDAVCLETAPPSYTAATVQFNRHLKGPMQNLLKHCSKIVKANNLSISKKVEALILIANPLIYPFALSCVVFTALTYMLLPRNFLVNFWLSPIGILLAIFTFISFPYISLIISFQLPVLLLIMAFPVLLLIAKRRSSGNYAKGILGAMLIWNDNMLNGTVSLVEMLIRKESTWTPTPKIKGKCSKSTVRAFSEAILRVISASLILSCIMLITFQGRFTINILGLSLPAVGWILSSFILLGEIFR